MKNTKTILEHMPAVLAAAAAMALITGCSAFHATTPVTLAGTGLKGNVHGGQQPVSGAQIVLYAASTAGYGAASTSLLTTPVSTDAHGNFDITGAYTCTPGQQFYIVSVGGDPGAGVNSDVALLSALGDCSNLTASSFININEVTTVASVYALAPFMTDYAHVGTSSTNTQGLAHAFNNVNKLANIATGKAGGSALPAGATIPTAELDSIADILAACVNSVGAGGPCDPLFAAVTPSGGTAPTDTVGLALGMAKHPTLNVAQLFNYSGTVSPFNPQLAAAPGDWTMSITYSTGGMSAPSTTTVDANGNVWIANSGNNTLTVLSQSGAPISGSPFTGNGLNAPSSIAIDSAGNAWLANKGGASVSAFTATGGALTGSPFTGGGSIAAPTSIAIDAPGNIWVANSGNNSITRLASDGSFASQSSTGSAAPSALAINPH